MLSALRTLAFASRRNRAQGVNGETRTTAQIKRRCRGGNPKQRLPHTGEVTSSAGTSQYTEGAGTPFGLPARGRTRRHVRNNRGRAGTCRARPLSVGRQSWLVAARALAGLPGWLRTLAPDDERARAAAPGRRG